MQTFLIDIGIFSFGLWDILDILITGYLIFIIIRLLRGTLAFPIFVGLITIFFAWWIVDILEMQLLSMILGQFVNIGVILIVIIFQPEIRNFLLYLGNSTMIRRRGGFLSRLFPQQIKSKEDVERERMVNAIKSALLKMAKSRIGALIVFATNMDMESLQSSGVKINADISRSLLISIFSKDSPLHDGAVILKDGKILTASSILPVSEAQNLPQSTGLRHRSAVGVTENTSVTAFVVSEERGTISYAREGQLHMHLSEEELYENLMKYYM